MPRYRQVGKVYKKEKTFFEELGEAIAGIVGFFLVVGIIAAIL